MITRGFRKSTSILCILLMVTPCWLLPGCAVPPPGEDASISKTQFTPGEFLKVTTSRVVAGQIYEVRFTTGDGFAVPVEVRAEVDGALYVAVPPVLDPETGVFSSGTMSVTASALGLNETINVLSLPAVQGVASGAILETMLQASIEDYEGVRNALPAVQAEVGASVNTTAAAAAVDVQLASLRTMLTEVQTNRTLTVSLPEGGTTTLSSAQLETVDRLLVAFLLGVSDESVPDGMSSKRTGAFHRDIGDCLAIPDSDQRLACIREVINGVRVATGRGTNLASGLATLVGLGIGLYGAVVAAPLVAATGLVVAVIGGATSYTNAAVNNQNSDAFLNGNRPGFDASTEGISQTIRVGTSAGSNIPGPIGQVSGAVNVGLSVRDIMSSAEQERCSGQNGPSQQANDEVILAFCTADPGDGSDGAGTLTGTVVDAQTGDPLAGVAIVLDGGGGAASSGGSGSFTIGSAPTGTYTLSASLEGYATSTGSVTIAADQTTETVIALVALSSGSGETIVVVLSWGSSPSDLDLHMSGPDGAGGRFHAYYSNKSPAGHVFLDLDDTSSFGPETMTISTSFDGAFVAGEYRIWVHKFSSTPAFNVSGATVTVFALGAQLAQFPISGAPSENAIDLWHVVDLTINESGAVTTSPVGSFGEGSASDTFKVVKFAKP